MKGMLYYSILIRHKVFQSSAITGPDTHATIGNAQGFPAEMVHLKKQDENI